MDMNIVTVWLHIIAIVVFTGICVISDPLNSAGSEHK
jgi:hypothetical protein